MEQLKHFLLPEHTNKLYKEEAISSISLTKEVAEKINELVDAYNSLNNNDIAWKQEYDGKLRKGILYRKDNLLNTIYDMLKLYLTNGDVELIIAELINGKINDVIERFETVASVREHGAVGDGIQDDTEAFQKTIDSGAKIIYVPAGTYKVDHILIPSNIVLRGDSTNTIILHAEDSTEHLMHTKDFDVYADGEYRSTTEGCVENVSIENLTIKGSNVDGKNGISLYGYNITLHDIEVNGFDG